MEEIKSEVVVEKKSRAKTLDLHEWTDDDTILALYYGRFGLKNLYLKTEDDMANFIGTTVCSLKRGSMNMRFLMGCSTRTLTDFSKQQKRIYDEFGKYGEYKLFCKVKEIIDQDEVLREQEFKKLGKTYTRYKKLQ